MKAKLKCYYIIFCVHIFCVFICCSYILSLFYIRFSFIFFMALACVLLFCFARYIIINTYIYLSICKSTIKRNMRKFFGWLLDRYTMLCVYIVGNMYDIKCRIKKIKFVSEKVFLFIMNVLYTRTGIKKRKLKRNK